MDIQKINELLKKFNNSESYEKRNSIIKDLLSLEGVSVDLLDKLLLGWNTIANNGRYLLCYFLDNNNNLKTLATDLSNLDSLNRGYTHMSLSNEIIDMFTEDIVNNTRLYLLAKLFKGLFDCPISTKNSIQLCLDVFIDTFNMDEELINSFMEEKFIIMNCNNTLSPYIEKGMLKAKDYDNDRIVNFSDEFEVVPTSIYELMAKMKEQHFIRALA